MKNKPSNKPQFFANAGSWYYENNGSIDIYRSCSTQGAGVGRIRVSQLIRTLERIGYTVKKAKP